MIPSSRSTEVCNAVIRASRSTRWLVTSSVLISRVLTVPSPLTSFTALSSLATGTRSTSATWARPEVEPASSERLSTRPPASVTMAVALSAAAVVSAAVNVADTVLTMSRSASAGLGALSFGPFSGGGAVSGAAGAGAIVADAGGASGAVMLGECPAAQAGAVTETATGSRSAVARRRRDRRVWASISTIYRPGLAGRPILSGDLGVGKGPDDGSDVSTMRPGGA